MASLVVLSSRLISLENKVSQQFVIDGKNNPLLFILLGDE